MAPPGGNDSSPIVQVKHAKVEKFIHCCIAHPRRSTTLCSRSARTKPSQVEVEFQGGSDDAGQGIIKVRIKEVSTADGWTGFRFSPSALLLCQWIAKRRYSFRAKDVVELGAGVGLCGALVNRLGGHITWTDVMPGTLTNLQKYCNNRSSSDIVIDAKVPTTNNTGKEESATAALARQEAFYLNFYDDAGLDVDAVKALGSSGSPEEKRDSHGFPTLPDGRTFDAIVFSDILYELPQAIALPQVVRKRLNCVDPRSLPTTREGDEYGNKDTDDCGQRLPHIMSAFVVREVPMIQRYFHELGENFSRPVTCTMFSLCGPCAWCKNHLDDRVGTLGTLPGIQVSSQDFAQDSVVTFESVDLRQHVDFCKEFVQAHEECAILMEARVG